MGKWVKRGFGDCGGDRSGSGGVLKRGNLGVRGKRGGLGVWRESRGGTMNVCVSVSLRERERLLWCVCVRE